MGDRFFSKFQYGKETTRGTAVAATKMLGGAKISAISADRKPRTPEENVGVRATGLRKLVDQYLVKETISISDGYFQILPLLFGCGLKGGITPSMTTVGQNDYLWNFTPSMASGVANNPDSFSGQKGDDTQAFLADYCMLERIKISGQVAQGADAAPVAIEAEMFGRQWTPGSFTGAIAIPVATSMSAKLARVYLDSSWAAMGTTEIANALRSFEIDILTGVHATFSGSGNKYFNKHEEGIIGAQITMTLEGKTAANAIYTAFHTDPQVLQVVKLAINGPQIGTGTPHNLSVAVGGMWEEVVPLGDEDRGNNLHTMVLGGLYDATGAKMIDVQVTTNSNAY